MSVEYKKLLFEIEQLHLKKLSKKCFKSHEQLLIDIEDSTSFLKNDVSLSERLYCIRNGIHEQKMCPVCKKNPLKFSKSKLCYYESGCCQKCSKNNIETKKKTKQTNLKKYGYESHNSSEIIKEKKKQIFLKKYGVTNPSCLEDVKEKRNKTSLKHFGCTTCLKLSNVRKCRNEIALKESYENFILKSEVDEPVFSLDDYLKRKSDNDILKFKCKLCGNIFETTHHDGIHAHCPKCFKNGNSFQEYEISQFLKSLNIYHLRNTQKIIPLYELDIYIPEKKLAIEFDGLYWHNADKVHKNYHLKKTELCEKQGIQLIHIFENEWIYKQDIVKSKIKNLLGIFQKHIVSEKCEFKQISVEICKKFLIENCLFEKQISNLNFGLFFKNELVYVVAFRQKQNKHDFELIVSCSKLNHKIFNALNFVLNQFQRFFNVKYIEIHVDRRWSNGNEMKNSEFSLIDISSPKILCFDDKKQFQNNETNCKYKLYDCGTLYFAKNKFV